MPDYERDYTDLSKTIAHALRHEPWLYELELDDEGWVPVEQLLDALHRHKRRWDGVDVADLERLCELADKERYELDGSRIRALYGHSIPGRLSRIKAEPPDVLYHGTSPGAADLIIADGLRPMARQYVHLSTDIETAAKVGGRKCEEPVILVIDAKRAHGEGVAFYRGNDCVWLADYVAERFILLDEGGGREG